MFCGDKTKDSKERRVKSEEAFSGLVMGSFLPDGEGAQVRRDVLPVMVGVGCPLGSLGKVFSLLSLAMVEIRRWQISSFS